MSSDFRQLQLQIHRDFKLEVPNEKEALDLDKLKIWLAREIAILLNGDFQSFLNLLYRIDISEENAKAAFADPDPAFKFANLIIDRELQKVASRNKYK